MTAAGRPSVTPRVGDTITTAEQLDALPKGAVLRAGKKNRKSGLGRLIQVHGEGGFSVDGVYEIALRVDLPATVLYVPGEPSRPSVTDNARAEAAAALRATVDLDPRSDFDR